MDTNAHLDMTPTTENRNLGGLDLVMNDVCLFWCHLIIQYVSGMSAIFAFVVIFIELKRHDRREFPTNLPIVFATVALGYNMNLAIGPFIGMRQITDYDTSRLYSTVCILQAFFYQFFGTGAIFWFFCFTNIMYNIIVKGIKVSVLNKKAKKYYLGGFFVPLFLAILPLCFDAYGPKTDGFPIIDGKKTGIECWINDAKWQFGIMIWMIMAAAVWGAYRGSLTVLKLRKTSYKSGKSIVAGALKGKGEGLLQTLREHLKRQQFFIGTYLVFAIINMVYFCYNWVHRDTINSCGK